MVELLSPEIQSKGFHSPKFFMPVDDWLVNLNLGVTWKSYFIVRAAVLFYTVMMMLLITLFSEESLVTNFLTFIFVVPMYFVWSWLFGQWAFTRALLALQVSLYILVILATPVLFILSILGVEALF